MENEDNLEYYDGQFGLPFSNIDDIENGDNFADYSKWFYEEYGKDIFDCTDDATEPFHYITGKVIC